MYRGEALGEELGVEGVGMEIGGGQRRKKKRPMHCVHVMADESSG